MMHLIVNKEYLSANGALFQWENGEVQVTWGNTRVTAVKNSYKKEIAVSIEDIFDPRYPKTRQIMRFGLDQTMEADLSKVDIREIAEFVIKD